MSHRTHIVPLIAIATLVAAMSACDVAYEGRSINENGFSLRPAERHEREGSSPVPGIILTSTQYFECANYKIAFQTTPVRGGLRIEILGAGLPSSVCLTAFGPASGFVVLDQGARRIQIAHQGNVDAYDVSVSESAILVNPIGQARFTQLEYQLAWRFPERSFLLGCNVAATSSGTCKQFYDRLSAAFDLEVIDPPDVGNWPYGEASSGATHFHLRYQSEAVFEQIVLEYKALVAAHLDEDAGEFIWLQNWRARLIIPSS